MNARQEIPQPGEKRTPQNRITLLDITALPPLTPDQERFLHDALALRTDEGIDPKALMQRFVLPNPELARELQDLSNG